MHTSLGRCVGTHPLPFHQLHIVLDLETSSLLSERSTLGYIDLCEDTSLNSIQHLPQHAKLPGQHEQRTDFVRAKTGHLLICAQLHYI